MQQPLYTTDSLERLKSSYLEKIAEIQIAMAALKEKVQAIEEFQRDIKNLPKEPSQPQTT